MATLGKEEWRFSIRVNGVRYVMTGGECPIVVWCVDGLDMWMLQDMNTARIMDPEEVSQIQESEGGGGK